VVTARTLTELEEATTDKVAAVSREPEKENEEPAARASAFVSW